MEHFWPWHFWTWFEFGFPVGSLHLDTVVDAPPPINIQGRRRSLGGPKKSSQVAQYTIRRFGQTARGQHWHEQTWPPTVRARQCRPPSSLVEERTNSVLGL